MKMTIWQFVGLIVLAAIAWFVIYTWMPGQDHTGWIDKMNTWFMKAEPKGVDEGEGS